MTTEGVDFADGRPGGTALVAAGKHFVVRYVPYTIIVNGTPTPVAKGLTAAEVADYRAHGLDIGLVWESTANRALSGQAAGAADGRTAQAAARGLGFPDSAAIYFSVDFDATDAQLPAIDAYLAGAAMILGASRTGVYGGRRVVAHCQGVATVRWFWQTYAWSSGTILPGIHLHQYRNGQSVGGSLVDLDHALQANFGQWAAPLSGGIEQPGGDMPPDPVKASPVAMCDLAATLAYLDAAGTQPTDPPDQGGAGVDLYWRAGPGSSSDAMPNGAACLRFPLKTGDEPSTVFVNDAPGVITNVRLPGAPAAACTEAELAAATQVGFNDAKKKAGDASAAAIAAIS